MGLVLYICIALVVVLCLLLMIITHAGYFYSLRIRTSIPLSVPRKVAYKVHRGAYSNSGTTYGDLSKLAPHLTTFGIYYDDPKTVPECDLRCVTGCCLPLETATLSLEEQLKVSGFNIWTFPECENAVITEFPSRSMLSCLIAPKCVYPALKKYYSEFNISHTGPVIELYESDCIRYITPIENNEGFFVPEVARHQTKETKKEFVNHFLSMYTDLEQEPNDSVLAASSGSLH